MARKYTNKLLEMLEEGLLSDSDVVVACLKYMSEYDVKDMMEWNEFIDCDDTERSEGLA